jgi:predicted nucleic acid-binding Zn finger protein
MMREPMDFEAMRFQSDEERRADQLILGGMVDLTRRHSRAAEGRVTDNGRDLRVSITLDDDERLADAKCRCDFFRMNALRKGPCEHILALRRVAAEGGQAGRVLRGPWEAKR